MNTLRDRTSPDGALPKGMAVKSISSDSMLPDSIPSDGTSRENTATELPGVFQGRRKRLLSRLIANGVAQGGAAGGFALALRRLLDTDAAGAMPWAMFAISLLCVLAISALRWQERIDAERLGQSYVRDLRLRLFDHLGRLPPTRLRRVRHGNLSLRFIGDMSALRAWASRGLARAWVATAIIAGVLGVLAWLDPRFAFAVAAVLALGAGAMAAGAATLDASVRAARKRRGRFAASINEQLQRFPLIQAYAQRDAERRAVLLRSRRAWNASIVLARRSGLMIAISAATAGLATLSVVLLGDIEPDLSRGTLFAAILLVSLLGTPLHRLGRIFELWRTARVAREKLAQLLRLAPETRNAEHAVPLPKGRGAIEFRRFELPGLCAPVDRAIRAGERVLVCADTSAAASALLWSLPRLGDGYRGRVRIDGGDIAAVRLGSLRRAVSLIAAELPLIRGTLLENLRYRSPDAGLDEIEALIERCDLREVVARLPRGWDTPLGDGGRQLGATERVRVCWARALLGRPRILLIDDVQTQWQGGNREAFFAMLRGFRGTVLMSGEDTAMGGAVGQSEVAIWRLPAPATQATNVGRTDVSRANVAELYSHPTRSDA